MGVKKKEGSAHMVRDAEKGALAEQRQKKPLEGSIKQGKIEENRNKIQGIAVFHDTCLCPVKVLFQHLTMHALLFFFLMPIRYPGTSVTY
jgi:hypothetical protein